MRINHKWVLAAGLLAGSVIAFQSRSDFQQWIRRHQSKIEGLEEAVPSTVYFLQTNRWLEFEIPKDTPLARLVSNASISPGNKVAPGTQWPYAIEYELQGGRDTTNVTGIYYFKGEQVYLMDKQTGKPVEVNSYMERRFVPLGGRRWIMNLNDPALPEPHLLRLRLHSSHPDLPEIGVRVYFRAEVPERKVAYMWNRLSNDQKRDLARGNVYSFEGLSEHEKLCLLRYHWNAVAPTGIPGRDFERRAIFVRDDAERLQALNNWVPAGLAVDAEHFAVLPKTNTLANCYLEVTDYATEPQTVFNTLLWHGERQQIETNHLTWSGNIQAAFPSTNAGMMQISSSHSVYVRTFQVEQGQTNEFTPEPSHLLTFTCSPTNSVDYDISHVGDYPSFLRIDLRRALFFTKNPPAVAVHYDLLTEKGDSLQLGDMTLTNAFSPYDWLVINDGLTNITAPQSFCFVLPSTVRTVRISSSVETVFVNAYSRPSQLVKHSRIPEDYSPGATPEQPAWFTVRPQNQYQHRDACQSAMVRVQRPPNEFDPLVQAGQYEWDSFLPDAGARGQMVLLPPTDSQPPRLDTLPFCYFPVGVGSEQSVRFQSAPWQSQVEPTLMLVSTSGSPGKATVTVDGQIFLDNRLESPVTAVRLGTLKSGGHKLTITTTSPVFAYLNHLESATNAAYLQRFCVMATSNIISFPYVKRQSDEEMLVLKVFSPAGALQPFEVQLKLKSSSSRGNGPFSDLTFMEREAQVTPTPISRTWLVASTGSPQESQLNDGEPIFFPIGTDLPAGRYNLEVKITPGTPHWLSLTRTTPGLAEKLKLAAENTVF